MLSFSAAADRFITACEEWTDERHTLATTAIRHIAADLDNRRMSAALLGEMTKLMRVVMADRPPDPKPEVEAEKAEEKPPDPLAEFMKDSISGLQRV